MPFRTGAVSYARFRVVGGPSAVDLDVLDLLAAGGIQPPSVGAPPEVQAGWVGPRHVLDTSFDPDEIVFGERLLFGMRVDTSRVPPDLRRAYLSLAEQAQRSAAAGPMAAGERRVLREEVDDRCRAERAAGRHQRSRMVPILWDVETRTLLAPIFGESMAAVLREFFGQTFDGTLEPLGAGGLAAEILEGKGRRRAFEDLMPSPFTPPPASGAGDGERAGAGPPIPWSPPVGDLPDYLGNEFIMWLWLQTETGRPAIPTDGGDVAIAFDRALDMECAWDVTGRQMLRADAPTRLPEAGRALQLGKWPRKVGLLLAARGDQCELTLQGDRFLVTGYRLPRPDTPPATPREGTEQRIDAVLSADRMLLDLYRTFLMMRTSDEWTAERVRTSEWITARLRAPGAPAAPPTVDLVGV